MKKNIYTYIERIESLCCTPETNNIVNQLYFNKKKKKKIKNILPYMAEGTLQM